MSIIVDQRHLFDIPQSIAYFNCAYNSPQLNASRERLLDGASQKSHPWNRTPTSFFEDVEIIRPLASDLFGGIKDGYAVVPSASYGISTAARAIEPQLRAGDVILILAEEFPSNVLPWKRVAQESGATLRTVPSPKPGSETWAQAILECLDRNTRVVAASLCHWTNGARIDLHDVARACREFGSTLVVDATQSLGAMPLNMEQVKPDFLVAAGYKWLLCPYGFSLMYVSERWRNSRPLEETWLARNNAEDFASLVNYSDNYRPGARRFDVGETCTPSILPGAIAALEQIKTWGVEHIADSLGRINARIAALLEDHGFQVPLQSQRSPHMFGAKAESTSSTSLVAHLRAQNIFVSLRGNSIRFSPHLHVNDFDIDRLSDALGGFRSLDFLNPARRPVSRCRCD